MSQLVLVDDTDSGIQYTGPWVQARGTQGDLGNFGPPFQNTLHGVNVNASLSYTFTGTQVTATGTSLVDNMGGSVDPSWECFVDGDSIGSKPPILFSENNWVLCASGTLSPGSHTIRVVATVMRQQTFWFDRIQYTPTSGANLNGRTVYISDSDSRVQFGSDWQPLKEIVTMTQTNGASMTFQFTGTSVSWFGFTAGGFPSTSSQATYSIDGGSSTTFLVPGLASGAMELYNQVLFQTPQLSNGEHTLTVVHQGNSQQAPLTLDYFVIIGGTANTPTVPVPSNQGSSNSGGGSSNSGAASSGASLAAASASASGTSSSSTNITSTAGSGQVNVASGVPTSLLSGTTARVDGSAVPATSSTSSSEMKSVPLGAIIGGAVGGFAVLVVLILGLLLLRRRKRESNQGASDSLIVEPFVVGPSSTVSYSRHATTLGGESGSIYHTPPVHKAGPDHGFGHSGQMTSSPMNRSNSRPTFSSPPSSNESSNRSPCEQGGSASSKVTLLAESRSVNRTPSEPVAGPSSSPNPVSPSSGARFVRHEDSGVRIPRSQVGTSVVDLPPLYTPG